jgi:DNA gyrase/topoisomerase IV subunit B
MTTVLIVMPADERGREDPDRATVRQDERVADDEHASRITVLHSSEAVRRRPWMYFGGGHGDLRLPQVARVLLSGVHHVLVAEPVDVEFMIETDLRWTITDNGCVDDGPHHGTLLRPSRPRFAAVAAISTWTRVEVWQDGRTWCQDLCQAIPLGEPLPGEPRAGRGTRMTVELDPAYFPADAALPADTTTLMVDVEGHALPLPGDTLRIVDLRAEQVLREEAAVVLEGLVDDPDLGDHARG